MRVRVLTMNVQNLEGAPERQDRLNAALRQLNPDVVSLQEVASAAHLARLLEGTGLYGTHQEDLLGYQPPYADRFGGTAVATRAPHEIVEILDQRLDGASDVPWATIAAKHSLPGLGEQLVICTVSSWRLDAEEARERQALRLVDLDSRHRGMLPTIVAGDLNAGPDASSVRYLTGKQSLSGRSTFYLDAWEVGGDGAGAIWTTDNPAGAEEIAQIVRQPRFRRRFDYVLIGSWHSHPDARAEIVDAQLVGADGDAGWASDHYALCVDLDVSIDQETTR